jgi:hypothetical protein
MPKVTVAFNLPEEQSEYKLHTQAIDMHTLIFEWSNELRNKTKYGDGKKVSWEDVRDSWWKLCNEMEIDPYGD